MGIRLQHEYLCNIFYMAPKKIQSAKTTALDLIQLFIYLSIYSRFRNYKTAHLLKILKYTQTYIIISILHSRFRSCSSEQMP